MKIFLDDVRSLPTWAKDWILVKTYDECINYLNTCLVDEISLDHDLGTEKTGYDVATWIEKKVYTTQDYKIQVHCHSANPVGRQRIEMVIRNINKRVYCERSTN